MLLVWVKIVRNYPEFRILKLTFCGMSASEKNSEYNQEIPQSQTADNPMAPRGRATQPSRDTMKILSKATSSLFPIKMIAILEWT